jgi:hypothetical protein
MAEEREGDRLDVVRIRVVIGILMSMEMRSRNQGS